MPSFVMTSSITVAVKCGPPSLQATVGTPKVLMYLTKASTALPAVASLVRSMWTKPVKAACMRSTYLPLSSSASMK